MDTIANDLVGVRLVIRVALAVPLPEGFTGAAREELLRREREAGDLLRVVLHALGGDTRPSRANHWAPGAARFALIEQIQIKPKCTGGRTLSLPTLYPVNRVSAKQ